MMKMPSYFVSKYFSVVYFCLSVAPSHGQAPVILLSATVIFWRFFTLAMGMHIAHATGSQCTSHYNTKRAVLQIGLSPRCSVLCPDLSRKLFQSMFLIKYRSEIQFLSCFIWHFVNLHFVNKTETGPETDLYVVVQC